MLEADSRVAGEVITVVVCYDPLKRGVGMPKRMPKRECQKGDNAKKGCKKDDMGGVAGGEESPTLRLLL